MFTHYSIPPSQPGTYLLQLDQLIYGTTAEDPTDLTLDLEPTGDYRTNYRFLNNPTPTDTRIPRITSSSTNNNIFSPNSDGEYDTATVSLVFSENATVTVDILNSVDTVVATTSTTSVGSLSYTWDGLDDSGDPFSDDLYTFRIYLEDAAGNNRTDETISVRIDTTPPALTLNGDAQVYLAPGETYTDEGAEATDAVSGDLTDDILTVEQAPATDGNGHAYYLYSVTDTVSNTSNATRTITYPVDYSTDWITRLGGEVYAVATNPQNGNIVIAGGIEGVADLNGDGDTIDPYETATTTNGERDIFISVFDASGTHQWSKRLGGTRDEASQDRIGLAVNTSGLIAVTSDIDGDADLNGDSDFEDPYETASSTFASHDIFLSVFDASGTHQWSKRLGGEGLTDFGYGVAIDGADDIILTGSVEDAADLNGDGDVIDTNETPAVLTGDAQPFISVFDSTGVHKWSRRISANSGLAFAITTNTDDDIVVTGEVQGVADLNGDGDTSDPHETQASPYGQADIFITAFDTTGDHLWSKRLGGTGANDAGWSITTDAQENVSVTGKVIGTADLNGDGDTSDPHETQASPYGGVDAFLSVFDSAGTHQWSKRLGGIDGDAAYAVTADADSNIILVGQTTLVLSGTPAGTADLNGDGDTSDPHETQASPYGQADIFISVFNPTGTHQWAQRLGGVSNDRAYAVSVDVNGRVFLGGAVYGTADLNGDGDTTDQNEVSTAPGLVVAFTPSYSPTPPTLSLDSTTAGTNPAVTGTAGSASSTIFTVEYQVNATNGAWSSCTAGDGTFDEASETFTCAVATGRSAGTYTAYVRSTDMNWNTTLGGSEASISFTVTAPPSGGGGGGGSSSRKKETPATTTAATTTKAVTSVAQPTKATSGASSATSDILALINLLIALDIIPADKADLARTYVATRTATPVASSLSQGFRFTRTLSFGDTHPEVRGLQQFLNASAFTVAETGPGSAGNETDYFGPATRSAVSRFQEAYRADILTPAGFTTPTGMFGPNSIKKANALITP